MSADGARSSPTFFSFTIRGWDRTINFDFALKKDS